MGQARILSATEWDPPRAAVAIRAFAQSRRVLFVSLGLLSAHLLLVLNLRVIAWPEVTTPAYLTSQGLLLYQDIKFVHAPGMISLLGLFFAGFGVSATVLRLFALLGPLLAHAALLGQTRRFSVPERLLASGFFIVLFYGWQGNSIWPSVLMSALTLPIVWALARRRVLLAGLLIGIAILIKQTAAFLLLLVVVRLVFERRWRDAGGVALAGSLPYVVGALIFVGLGAGEDYVRWTLLVPFTVLKGVIDVAPSGSSLLTLAIAFLPLVLQSFLERPGEHEVPAHWHLLVASGFALLAYPRFGFLHLVPSVPSLAVGAARLLRGPHPRMRTAALAAVAVIVFSRGAVLVAGETFDGRVLFWDESPAFNALVARLELLPSGRPLAADLWENILPRTGRLPPGGVYFHPWLTYLAPVDQVGERSRAAAERPGTLFVRYRRAEEPAASSGPYAIEQR